MTDTTIPTLDPAVAAWFELARITSRKDSGGDYVNALAIRAGTYGATIRILAARFPDVRAFLAGEGLATAARRAFEPLETGEINGGRAP